MNKLEYSQAVLFVAMVAYPNLSASAQVLFEIRNIQSSKD